MNGVGRDADREPIRMRLAPNPSPMTLDGTRSFVVGHRRPVVVDPGPDDADHLAALKEALAGRPPVAILLTHHHPDHAAAAAPLAAATGAPVLMAPGALDIGFPPVRPDRWLREGDVLDTDVGAVRAIATPGHAPEHMAFLWQGPRAPAGGALLTGDLLMGEGETTLLAAPEADLPAYLGSLRRVAELAPGVLLPGHGPPLTDARAAVERFRRHREQRVAQLLDALRRGPADAAELVRHVYGDTLDPRLRAAAEASVQAVLEFLIGVGSAIRRGERYAAVPDVPDPELAAPAAPDANR